MGEFTATGGWLYKQRKPAMLSSSKDSRGKAGFGAQWWALAEASIPHAYEAFPSCRQIPQDVFQTIGRMSCTKSSNPTYICLSKTRRRKAQDRFNCWIFTVHPWYRLIHLRRVLAGRTCTISRDIGASWWHYIACNSKWQWHPGLLLSAKTPLIVLLALRYERQRWLSGSFSVFYKG